MELTAIAPIALATSALSTLVDPPKLNIKPMMPSVSTFNISNFQAYSVIEDSKWSFVHFSISVETLWGPTFCTAHVITLDSHLIGDFALKNCAEPHVSFTLTRAEDNGAQLEVFHALAPPWTWSEEGDVEDPGALAKGEGEE
ncbi:hypothetical protein B0T14DRAFT_563694 [Immersiella caudata]|uniref:Uncharacterized protein n=1 Tax=Immersiella caudata TaxID=314043 RepID=A0AA39X5Y7_9PEZI|nr:hypothetical protein B0T14DRAFT_563694 [Immersiella caudata]